MCLVKKYTNHIRQSCCSTRGVVSTAVESEMPVYKYTNDVRALNPTGCGRRLVWHVNTSANDHIHECRFGGFVEWN
jgi:hypothetical protein